MNGEKISYENGAVSVPDNPVVLFIEGDGIGPDIWRATQSALDFAVKRTYGGMKMIAWKEVIAGDKSFAASGHYLSQDAVDMIHEYKIAIKGPLTTPVGGGMRSINVLLRKLFNLYANVRPVRHIRGVPSPVCEPEKVNMVVFRENLEDVYAGIEWKHGSEEAKEIIRYIKEKTRLEIDEDSGIGIKPMSAMNSKNLIRRAIRYAIDNHRRSVTLVHKGNIMKYTEGAFREWGYELAREEFGDAVITEQECWDRHNGKPPQGMIMMKDRIADDMFQQVLLRPSEYDVIAASNLNGDYLSDALAAQVGGVGIAPGANFGDSEVIFESIHGSAPKYANRDMANPGALMLTGEMLLRFIGWHEAADRLRRGLEDTILQRRVTQDLARRMTGAAVLKCSEFGKALEVNMQ